MKLYELFNTVLTELRRNPELNPKEEGHSAAIKFLQGKDLSRYGVSMTDLPKLGVNPGSKYNTPIGIYFYPALYYMAVKQDGKRLVFQDEAKYIQIIEFLSDPVEIDGMDLHEYKGYIAKLYDNLSKVSQLMSVSEAEAKKLLSSSIIDAASMAKNKEYGGKLWYILYALSREQGVQKRSIIAPRSAVIWNSLLRLIDIDILIDKGSEIIHENEPYQGVALNPRSVRLVATMQNKEEDEESDNTATLKVLASKKPGPIYIANFLHAIKSGTTFDPKYKKECDAILNNCLTYLRGNPRTYTILSDADIHNMLNFTTSRPVRQEMTIEYYNAKFPKIKNSIDSKLADWEDAMQSGEYKAHKKSQVRTMIIEPHELYKLQGIYNSLKKYEADPKAKGMMDYIADALKRFDFEPS